MKYLQLAWIFAIGKHYTLIWCPVTDQFVVVGLEVVVLPNMMEVVAEEVELVEVVEVIEFLADWLGNHHHLFGHALPPV